MEERTAAELAAAAVASVADDPDGRRRLLARLYEDPGGGGVRLPYRRAALAFMDWQLRRGLLNPLDSPRPGSRWWRAVNQQLLCATYEARKLFLGANGDPSSEGVRAGLTFIANPSARNWYRAHNIIIATAYRAHRDLAAAESRVERFFLNLVLLRVLYAHALVAAPRLALGWLAPVAPILGDPRLGMTGIFLSLSRVLPDRYPLGDDVDPYVKAEHGFGRLLDVGVIQPRVRPLYDWSAHELGIPEISSLLVDDIPAYVWDVGDADPWRPTPTVIARLVRRGVKVHASRRFPPS